MSLIERVADKLGPMGQTQRRPAAEEEDTSSRPDLLERAAGRKSGLPEFDFARDGNQVAAEVDRIEKAAERFEDSPVPARKTTARSLHIDLERLHKQSIITPGGVRTP